MSLLAQTFFRATTYQILEHGVLPADSECVKAGFFYIKQLNLATSMFRKQINVLILVDSQIVTYLYVKTTEQSRLLLNIDR